jgi:hypothetical protein
VSKFFSPTGSITSRPLERFSLQVTFPAAEGNIKKRGVPSMARFLIEVPHEAEAVACARVVDIFLKSGSHFLTHADWGCMDGEHKAWIVADVSSREEARDILPPAMRSQAKIVQLNYFTMEEIEEILRHHQA